MPVAAVSFVSTSEHWSVGPTPSIGVVSAMLWVYPLRQRGIAAGDTDFGRPIVRFAILAAILSLAGRPWARGCEGAAAALAGQCARFRADPYGFCR